MHLNQEDSLVTLLDWDTAFWGMRIARLNASSLAHDSAARVKIICEKEKVCCLYFSADGSSAETLTLANNYGFKFVDVRTDLVCESISRPKATDRGIRAATQGDLPLLKEIARSSHHDTRFFKDQNFDPKLAGDLYARWIERDFEKNTLLVCDSFDSPGTPCGYISCEQTANGEGRIGLIAVEHSQRGKGLGLRLVDSSLKWFSESSISTVRVATQGTNVSALRMYERSGFVTAEVRLWFHRWFNQPTIPV